MAKESSNISDMSGLAEVSNQLRGRPGVEAVGHIEGNSSLEHQSQGNDREIEEVPKTQLLDKRDSISATDKTNECLLPRSNQKDKGSKIIRGDRQNGLLIRHRRQGNDPEIEEVSDVQLLDNRNTNSATDKSNEWLLPKIISGDWQNGLLIVAILIATVTYQAGMAPPPSIWKEDMSLDLKCMTHSKISLKDSIRSCPAYTFYFFMAFNTAGFFSAIHLISIAFGGRRKDLAMVLLIVSLACMLFTYTTLLMSISKNTLSFLAIGMIGVTISTVLQILCILLGKLVTNHRRRYSRAQGVTAGRDCTLLEPAPNHVSSEDV